MLTRHRTVDIRPFALPNTPANEVWFEDPRNIERVIVRFQQSAPEYVSLSYLQKMWPIHRLESADPVYGSMQFGWTPIDDWFNSTWKEAATSVHKLGDRTLEITFKGLATEFPEAAADYDVAFRRTLALRIDVVDPAEIEKIEVYTKAEVTTSEIRVRLEGCKAASGLSIAVSAYNARIEEVAAESGVKIDGAIIRLEPQAPWTFRVRLTHLKPEGYFSYDEGLVAFTLDHDAFTISLDSLEKQGPIWHEEEGIFITFADDCTTLEEYLQRNKDKKTTAQMIMEREEQSLGGAMSAQPKPHPVASSVGCKHCRQRFWIEPNGDIVLHRSNVQSVPGADTGRFLNDGNGRLFFGLERWVRAGRSLRPGPIIVMDASFARDFFLIEQQAFAFPLTKSIFDDLAGDETIICLVRFRILNTGSNTAKVEIPVSYSTTSGRNQNRISLASDAVQKITEWEIPRSEREKLGVRNLGPVDSSGLPLGGIIGDYHGEQVLRCAFAGDIQADSKCDHVSLAAELAPGEERIVVFKLPYINLDRSEEIDALATLDFEKCLEQTCRFWQQECARGAQIKTPEPIIDSFHRGHLAFVEITDSLMPCETDLVNTSVGTSTYGNYTNESAMIVEELDERGLHDMASHRLNVWLKYQGSAGLSGLFTDNEGVFYGAGGYESGASYCQHHGWALWCLAKHYLITGDNAWLDSVADKLVKGIQWVARQRRQTTKELPHSRGWERGWLAPGGLEDVTDYFYWLSTNTMTFRGVEYVARAFETAGRPEAAQIRAEADDYRNALIAAFETARRHSPLVRLKDGRWIPHYPSRLYRRGRDVGWIREVLEGALYLLVGELYDPRSKQAQWILDDYLDNRYTNPQLGYPLYQPDRNWFDYGGFSQQPNLLAGLMPYLERDEPEIYIWMFFNAFAACYREDVGGMIEHPYPVLGFSNHVAYKTSDEANSVKWLRYMYVYACDKTLHLGRAIPREWLSDGNDIYAKDVATCFGRVSVRYVSSVANGTIKAEVYFDQRKEPEKLIVRFRHPGKLPIKSVTVNGRKHEGFDPATENVDISGMAGRIEILANYIPQENRALQLHRFADVR